MPDDNIKAADARKPRCCVVIAYWEAGRALPRSLESIDSRHLVDVIVVDDGSRALPARQELHGLASDLNVRLIELPDHRGVEHAANAGLLAAADAYEYIARLDCGDVCVSTRFGKQIDFLDQRPDCLMVGSWVDFVSMDEQFLYTVRHPVEAPAIRRRMFVNCALTQPAVMFRAKLIQDVGLYPIDRPAAEDFAYFLTVTKRYPVANIPEVLVHCIVNPRGISSARRRQQLRSRIRILLDHFEPNPLAVYGLLRASAQLVTPRGVTVWINSALGRARGATIGRFRVRRKPSGPST